MQMRDRNRDARYFLFAHAFCIFSFKFILIEFGESGIRFDDLVLSVVFFYIVFFKSELFLEGKNSALISYFWFLTLSFFSAVLSSWNGQVDLLLSIVFVARLFEYLLFFYIGFLIGSDDSRVNKIYFVYALALIVMVPLQMLGVLPTLSLFDASRASGNANGPYELAAIVVFLLLYSDKVRGNFILYGLTVVILFMTGSRITVFAYFMCLVAEIFLFKTISKKMISVVIFSVASILISVLFFGDFDDEESPIYRILKTKEAGAEVIPFVELYNAAPVYKNSIDYFDGVFFESTSVAQKMGGDDSGNIRMIRWSTLLKSTLDSWRLMAFGLGPSFGSSAVDGYYVRVFSETGGFGLFLFFIFLVRVMLFGYVEDKRFFLYVLALVITGGFIDIFVSYKPMILFWFWFGQLVSKRLKNENCISFKS